MKGATVVIARLARFGMSALAVGYVCAATATADGLVRPATGGSRAQGSGSDKTCSGKLSANVISPLPTPPVIRVHITDASSANISLGERFKAGMTAAGAKLADNGVLTMELATSITGATDASGAAGMVSPEFGLVGRMPVGGEPPVLTMSISLMDTTLAQIDWIAYVNCKIKVADLGDVAQDLGFAIGRAIGQTFPPRPL